MFFGRNGTEKVRNQKNALLFHYLTGVSALPGETQNPEIVSFHLNDVCLFANKCTDHIQIITWSQLNHSSFARQSAVCTRQDLGREHSILPSVTYTLDIFQVCLGVSRCVKMGVLPKPEVKVNGQYCWDILLPQQILAVIKYIADDNFVFLKDSTRVHCSHKQSNCCSVKFLTFLLLSYGPPNGPELISVDYKTRESSSIVSMNCKSTHLK